MFPTNHSTSDNKTMTSTAEKTVNPTPVTTSKPKYLVAVFSVLVVSIVAVLVVTVASQARNSTRQDDNNAASLATELRHPRFIGQPSTTETAESIILKNVKAFMRVVTPLTVGNNGTSAPSQILQQEIASVDNKPGASEVFSTETVI
ncbi:hypothetical protein GHT06_012419 [Daphnia sinensis]|uniref:Uncharacterized protein n=1 Tax=Daphnia sinensis TaxID=1820382 RepID=A0AAD5LEX0_9CRUS|nr:hypothetical protein GHT06_012419 [Daphnia sinensis]